MLKVIFNEKDVLISKITYSKTNREKHISFQVSPHKISLKTKTKPNLKGRDAA